MTTNEVAGPTPPERDNFARAMSAVKDLDPNQRNELLRRVERTRDLDNLEFVMCSSPEESRELEKRIRWFECLMDEKGLDEDDKLTLSMNLSFTIIRRRDTE